MVPYFKFVPIGCALHSLTFRETEQSRFYDIARGQQNHTVKSGDPCKRTLIWRDINYIVSLGR